jgi:cysteine desulfurase/selenocysteine lyase
MPLHDWIGVPATVRASFGLYNTRSEVDALLDAIHFALQKLRVEFV